MMDLGLTMNLINEIHHSCESEEYHVIVFQWMNIFLSHFLFSTLFSTNCNILYVKSYLIFSNLNLFYFIRKKKTWQIVIDRV